MQQVAAVVVTYHPGGDFIDRLNRLAYQVHWLIVVDNNSLPEVIDKLNSYVYRDPDRKLICNYTNHGIAKALNIGIEAARQLGATWVVTMDQDTIVDDGLVAELLEGVRQDGQAQDLAIVAANYIDSTGRPYVPEVDKKSSDRVYEAKTAITSGSMVRVEAWQAVGGYREDLFIDSVDHDFCFRVRKAGWRILQGRRALMHHQLGDTVRRGWFFGLKPAIANYGPIRRYYMSRNRVAMFKAHWKFAPIWVTKELLMIGVDAMLIFLYEKNKLVKVGSMIKGAWFGLWGRMGPYEPTLVK